VTELILPPLRRTDVDARAFAEIVHEGQADQAGYPYVEHLAGVAQRAARKIAGMPGILSPSSASEVVQIAWLHDTIEDHKTTGDDLLREGFSMGVVEGVRWMTKPHGVAYAAWIDDLAEHAPLPTLLVKLSDIEDNLDPERLRRLPPARAEQLRGKYEPAHALLLAAAIRHGWRPARE